MAKWIPSQDLDNAILMSLRTQEQLCRVTVQNRMEIVWTVFEKFEIFIERSGGKMIRLDK